MWSGQVTSKLRHNISLYLWVSSDVVSKDKFFETLINCLPFHVDYTAKKLKCKINRILIFLQIDLNTDMVKKKCTVKTHIYKRNKKWKIC